MAHKTVTSTEFRNKAGLYLDEAGKTPVFITKHGREARVLLDIEEYERLKALDARREKMKRLAAEDHDQFAELYKKLAQ